MAAENFLWVARIDGNFFFTNMIAMTSERTVKANLSTGARGIDRDAALAGSLGQRYLRLKVIDAHVARLIHE